MNRFRVHLTQLLHDVGSSQSEINKVINDFKNKFATSDIGQVSQIPLEQKRIKLEHGSTAIIPPPVKTKQLNLNKLTQEMNEEEKELMVVDSVKRILNEEKRVYIAPAQLEVKKKVLASLANEFYDSPCPKIIQDYIFQDLRNRHEISYAVIKKNFDMAALRASKRRINLLDNPNLLNKYIDCLHSYIKEAMNFKDIKQRDFILPRLYTESPYITDEAISFLEEFITNTHAYPLSTTCGLKILISLIENKPEMRQKLLLLLVELAKYDQAEVKKDAEKYAKELYESTKDNEMIKLFLEEELLASVA